MRRSPLRSLICAFLLMCAICRLMFGSYAVAQSGSAPACASPEYHQFDFWIGEWDIFDIDDLKTVTAHVRVESILDGCVLKETYEGANGVNGQSFSIFDRTRRVWHQTWVTSHGQLLIVEGQLTNGNMVLSGADKSPDGKDRLTRGTWIAQNGSVRETAVRSTDGGKTWQPWFDLIFKPVGSSHIQKPD
jgi:hypothetical protein